MRRVNQLNEEEDDGKVFCFEVRRGSYPTNTKNTSTDTRRRGSLPIRAISTNSTSLKQRKLGQSDVQIERDRRLKCQHIKHADKGNVDSPENRVNLPLTVDTQGGANHGKNPYDKRESFSLPSSPFEKDRCHSSNKDNRNSLRRKSFPLFEKLNSSAPSDTRRRDGLPQYDKCDSRKRRISKRMRQVGVSSVSSFSYIKLL